MSLLPRSIYVIFPSVNAEQESQTFCSYSQNLRVVPLLRQQIAFHLLTATALLIENYKCGSSNIHLFIECVLHTCAHYLLVTVYFTDLSIKTAEARNATHAHYTTITNVHCFVCTWQILWSKVSWFNRFITSKIQFDSQSVDLGGPPSACTRLSCWLLQLEY